MKKLKIGIIQDGCDTQTSEAIQEILKDSAMLELCTPVVCDEKTALRKVNEKQIEAIVFASASESTECSTDAVELIVMEKTSIAVLAAEPTADDIVKLHNIIERDFGLSSVRFAIVMESTMQNPDLANQVTTDHNINTYGPYTIEQIMANNTATHFDAIITADKQTAERLALELSQDAPVRYFAGKDTIVTAVYSATPASTKGKQADVSWLTHPFYTAIDIVRNRQFYDEARQNPLPKLFRDRRDDRRKDETSHTHNHDTTEKAS